MRAAWATAPIVHPSARGERGRGERANAHVRRQGAAPSPQFTLGRLMGAAMPYPCIVPPASGARANTMNEDLHTRRPHTHYFSPSPHFVAHLHTVSASRLYFLGSHWHCVSLRPLYCRVREGGEDEM
eukprot:2955730-Prymnesium_polylepis.1